MKWVRKNIKDGKMTNTFFFLSENEEVESTMSSDDEDTGIDEQGRYINVTNKETNKFKCNMKRY